MNFPANVPPPVSNLPMQRCSRAAVLLLAVAFATSEADAWTQEPVPAEKQTASVQSTAGAVRVFLDCNYNCAESFVKQEITFVDYMRDGRDADVHILLTTQGTGGGGTEYTIKFIGLGRFAGVEQTLKHVSTGTATSDERRRAIAEVLKQGLVRYVAESPLAGRLRISVAAGDGKKTGQQDPSKDPWNLWVFNAELGGSFSGEESSNSQSLRGELSANRTTEAWKMNFSAYGSSRESEFDLGEDGIFVTTSKELSTNALVVKSLTKHWSAGVTGRAGSSTFLNQDFAGRIGAGPEYNFFPYSESTRRLLTLQYTVGLDTFEYIEETVYGKTSEQLVDHRLRASFSMRQPWGSSFASATFNQFLTQPDKYSINAFGELSMRLFKGFSFNVFGEASRTRDQIYLPRGEASTEEILVRQRQLETGYSYYMNFGISYQFGSIFNNVVNPRFGG